MRLLSTLFALLCLAPALCRAQLTTITASHLNVGGQPIPSGMVTATPEDANANPIPFAQGGGGLNSPTAYSCSINNGGIIGTCQWPDSALTTPANICYSVTVIKTTAPARSYTLPKVCGITGSSWALDTYGPPAQTTAVQPLQVTSLGTASAPNPCLTPSVYMRTSNGGEFYICPAGVPVLVTGNSGNSVQKSGDAMTGPLVLPGDPTLALQASTKQYVDAHVGPSNPNTCTANTALDKCLGVAPYLAIAGDWSVAINQALSDLSTTGGTIDGCGLYPINGSFLHPTGSAVNTLLLIPSVSSVGSATNITIRLRGCQYTTPNANALSGMTLKTSIDTSGANFIYGENSGTFTAIKLVLEHTNVMSTHAAPNLNLLNASWINALSLEDVILAGTGCTAAPASNTGGIGLQTPNLSNNYQITVDKTVIACMPIAAILKEHTQIGTLWLGENHDCITLSGGGTGSNSISASMIWAQDCVNYLIGSSTPTGVNISVFDMESDPGTGLDIEDPSNLISGIVFYKKQSPSGAASISGGSNLLACNLNAISGCFGGAVTNPTNPFLENWKSQDGSGTTLANTGSDSTNAATTTNVSWSTSVTGFSGVPVAVYNGTTSVSTPASATQTAFDGTTPFSACAWFNISTLTYASGSNAYLMSNLSSASGNPGWRIGIFGTGATPVGGMDIYLISNVGTSNYIHVTTGGVFSAGALSLACMTYDGSKTAAGVLTYMNGTASFTDIVTDGLTGSMTSTAPLYIGGEFDGNGGFPGALGRVRIYNRKLSSAEISAMYSAGPNAI